MALNWRSTTGSYNDVVYDTLLRLEAADPIERLRGKLVNGNFTTGIGFDLVAGGIPVQTAVLKSMGLDSSFLSGRPPAAGTPERKEFDYVRELAAAFGAHKDATVLNEIMGRRAAAYQSDPAFASYLGAPPRSTFSFANDGEVRRTFDALWEPVYRKTVLDTWSELKADPGFATSKELLVLASMTWNGGPGLLIKSPSLRTAIQKGNRAEAWFQIRYETNGGNSRGPGIAKRRYVEAQLFGLYDDSGNVSVGEAKQVYAMLTTHRAAILKYESEYGIPPDGTSALRNTIALANNDANLVALGTVQSLTEALTAARNALINWANTLIPAERKIDVNSFNAAAIYTLGDGLPGAVNRIDASDSNGKGAGIEKNLLVGAIGADILLAGKGNDVLIGREGSDVLEGDEGDDQLYGGDDNDVLKGGTGADILYGGQGDDLYIWNAGDGNDTIIDEDGGRLLINGEFYTFAGGYMSKEGSSNVWRDATGNVVLTHNSPWRLELPDGSVIQLGEDFDPSEWGITLGESAQSGRVYLGDQRAKIRGVEVDLDILPGDSRFNTYKWTSTSWNADGSLSNGVAEANFNDVIRGSAGNDKISGLGGNDALDGGEGDDEIDGGVGDDLISGGKGRDTIRGGDGNDYIEGSGILSVPQRFSPDDNWQAPPGRQVYTASSTWGIYQSQDPNVITWEGAGNPAIDESGQGDVIDGGAGNDHIVGSWASDSIEGGTGDDWIDGIAGDDVISGGEGNDFLRGDGLQKSGLLDTVPGMYHGTDILDGGADNDRIEGGGNNDQLFGGSGDDALWGDEGLGADVPLGMEYHGDDYLSGGSGNDYLEGGGGSDVLDGGEGDDNMWGDADASMVPAGDGDLKWGDDVLNGGDGDDTLVGGGKNDLLMGGDGDDVLFGDQPTEALSASNQGRDVLDGGEGNDYLEGGGDDDVLNGGAGRDTLVGDARTGLDTEAHGNDLLDGGDDDDVLIGNGGDDTLLGGSGRDFIYGDNASEALDGEFHGDDYIDGGDGFDQLVGGGGNDTIFGGNDGDYIVGDSQETSLEAAYHGDDYLDGGDGNDTIEGGGGNDTLIGGDGDDFLTGDDAQSLVDPGTLFGNDIIYAGAGNDIAIGGMGKDIIDGGDGDDYIYAGEGDDVINGGGGSDVMYGGAGDDIFELSSAADGDLASLDFVIDEEGVNVVRFGTGIRPESLTVTRVNQFDLLISGGGIQEVVIRNAYLGSISVFEFDDGTTLDFATLIGQYALAPLQDVHINSSNRLVTGSAAADSIIIDAGGVTVSGGRGDDILEGRAESGAGTVYRYASGDGADVVRQVVHDSDPGRNQIVFGEGITLDDLQLSIEEGSLLIRIGSDGDRILLENSLAQDLAGTPSIGLFKFSDGTQIIYADLLARGIHMTDGGGPLTGTAFADLIQGTAAGTRIESRGGNDIIHAGGGDDVIIAGEGNDWLDGGSGNDVLDGGAGADVFVFDRGYGTDRIVSAEASDAFADCIRLGPSILRSDLRFYRDDGDLIVAIRDTGDRLTIEDYFGQNAIGSMVLADGTVLSRAEVLALAVPEPFTEGNDTRNLSNLDDIVNALGGDDIVFGRGGNDTLAGGGGADMLYGEAGDDTLIADGGDDHLSGGVGSDTYVVQANSGVITIDNDDSSADRLDTIRFAGGMTEDSLVIRRVGDDLVIVAGSSRVTVTNHFSNDGINATHIDRITFEANSTVLSVTDILARASLLTNGDDDFQGGNGDEVIQGRGGDDTLRGGGGNDVILGGDGNDKLYGQDGDDLLDAGAGTSGTFLSGGAGNDIYRLAVGFGGVSIENDDSSLSKTDAIEFGDGIAASDILMSRSGDNLILSRSGTADVVSVKGFFAQDGGTGQRVEQVRFADGTVWTYQALLARSLIGGAGMDYITGFGGADQISGGDGDDWLSGGGGDDRIDGGDGNDDLLGGEGNDTLIGGAGTDILRGDAGDDTLFADVGDDYLIGGAGSDTYVIGPGSGNTRISNDDTDIGRLDTVRFAHGITEADLVLRRAGDDLVIAAGGSRVTVTNHFANEGDNTTHIDRITFEDNATVLSIADILAYTNRLTDDDDDFQAGDGDDVVDGRAGNDTLRGGGGNDLLLGGEGYDRLYGQAGDDILDPGTGTWGSLLSGGAGNDTYRLAAGFGPVAIANDDASLTKLDVVEFGVGIGVDDILISRFDDDLKLSRRGTQDVVTVQGFFAQDGGTGQRVEQVRFADGTVWTYQDLLARSLLGGAGRDTIIGFSGVDVIAGQSGDDALYGRAGNDRIEGGDGDDHLYGEIGSDVLVGGAGDDTLEGDADGATAGDDELYGGDGQDTLWGRNGNDILVGGKGRDVIRGGKGVDIVRVGLGDGVDRIEATDVLSSADADVLAFDATIAPAMATMYRVTSQGGSRADLIILIDGGATQVVVTDYFSPGMIPAISRIEFADGTIWDNAYIAGHLSANYDNGHSVQTGTAGDDAFVVDDMSDVVQESANGGYDIVQSRSLSYYLSANVEEGVIVGPYGAMLGGSTTSKVLRGGVGNDELRGVERGFNTYYGGKGDDSYFVIGSGAESQAQESVVEYAGEGVDTVITDRLYHYQLGAEIENLIDVGFSTNYFTFGGQIIARNFVGNALDNVIEANLSSAAGYFIDGGAGADTMFGSYASDTFVVDNVGDVVVDFFESDSGSIDTVRSSITYALPQFIENLALIGSAAIDGYGSAADNVLSGDENSAVNHLYGGKGDDTYRIGVGDIAVELDGEGNDTVAIAYWVPGATFYLSEFDPDIENIKLDATAGAVNASGDDRDNVVTGNTASNVLYGGAGNDTISDGGGSSSVSDTLDGGAGDDLLIGGFGKTTYVFSRGTGHDIVDERGAGIFDSILVDASIDKGDLLLSRQDDNLVLSVRDSADTMTVLQFFASNGNGGLVDTIDWISFADGMQWGIFEIVALATRPRNAISDEADLILGAGGDDIFDAAGGDDRMWGGAGNDKLSGGAGNDQLFGGTGNDQLFGGAGDDKIRGEDGADTLHGGDGNDDLFGGDGPDASVGDVLFGDAGDDWLTGSAGNDVLVGGSGNDVLRGGAGVDTYRFGRGWGTDSIDDYTRGEESSASILEFDDTLTTADIIIERESADTFWVRSTDGDGALLLRRDDIEEIRFADGTSWNWKELILAMDTVTGTAGDDVLTPPGNYEEFMYYGAIFRGLGGNDRIEGGQYGDTLDGGTGADTMLGHGGDDTYVVDNTADVVTELSNEGNDTVISSVTYTLSNNVEALVLTGTLAIDGTGNTRDNSLRGNDANNVLNGGGGGDYMAGGLGDDTYVVDNANDWIEEYAGEGIDLVRSSISYSLQDTELENLTLTGSSGLTGTGNAMDNVLTGNSGANTLYGNEGNDRLDGGAGADSLRGGLGDDTYFVDNASDSVVELAGEGNDFVNSTVTHTLAANVENLRLTGTGAINGTGNALDNVIYAGSGNNTLDGLGGVDTVSYLYAASAVTVSLASSSAQVTGGSGSDTLRNVENLTGGNFNDTLTGNAGANVLDGGAGADKLIGGAGNDTYVLGRGYGADQITENDTTAGNQDAVLFGGNVSADQLWFSQSGNNLDVSIIGTGDKFTLNNWYLGNQYHVEQFRLANGEILQDTQVANLVQAMAAFAPPASGQTTLPANYASTLQPVIAANWH
ncbi:calcium-binding protein [Cupriavidus plantarum]|uniref:Ca2+-binding RTX toxin-like protein n=1 Tax=Cupriavidus plantarum TaxID=942865 RepID=A0A316F344_9BURK|nr:calcium-binding protein [Cupriavidus plantarum]PWK30688.1 Ca2+-binding RTX toxin-like protein [Cupriavidus plantarum]